MRTRRVDVGPIRLVVSEDGWDDGRDGRRILLVHGFTGAKENFGSTMDVLAARGWHVVAPDLRGHGSSDAPAGEDEYAFPVMAADLVGLADALGWDRFVLAGHSMGGALAQLVALDHPDRLDGLVLLGTFHGPVAVVDPSLVGLGVAIVQQMGMQGLAQALAGRRAANLEAQAAYERLEQLNPGHGARRESQLLACAPDMWLSVATRFDSQPDRLARLARLDVPTLVVVGENDDVMIDDCRDLGAAIPGARLVVVPGSGHSPHADAFEAWAAALTPFLDSLPVPVRPQPGP